MRTEAVFPQVSIEIEREDIPVEMMSPSKVPDEKWKYVDKQGHGHFWQKKNLPTLEWIVTGTKWIGDEYEGDEFEVGEWRCRLCGEVVEPGKRSEYGPSFISGPTWIKLSVNGEKFVLTPDEYAKSLETWAKTLRKIRG